LWEVPIASGRLSRLEQLTGEFQARNTDNSRFAPNCHWSYSINSEGPLNRVAANIRKLLDLGTAKLDFSTMPAQTLVTITESWMRRFSDPHWPTPIVASGLEIGQAIKYPAASIERDFSYVPHHPLREAYELYQKMPYDRETWDLTSVLHAVRPERGYFGLSPAGKITVDSEQITQFAESETGRHRYLTATSEQAARVREALVQLASQPPDRSR
jgi:hypothetical protein